MRESRHPIPPERQHVSDFGRLATFDVTLVTVTTEDGLTGYGEAKAAVGSAGVNGAVAASVEQELRPLLLGEDARGITRLWEVMDNGSRAQFALERGRGFPILGRRGVTVSAMSGIDMALWDLLGKSLGVPVYQLLGGRCRESLPAYASGGYYVEGKTPKKLGDEMASYVKAGFKAVKMKVGRLTPRDEEARVKAAREAVGPDIVLTLDANNAWSDVPTALTYMKRYEPYDPYWIEEPFGPDDIDGHAKLAELTPVIVATGEIAYGRWYHKELLDKRGAEILQTDACVCGGITDVVLERPQPGPDELGQFLVGSTAVVIRGVCGTCR